MKTFFSPLSPLLASLAITAAGLLYSPAPAAADTHARCVAYANTAVAQHRRNVALRCGYGGLRWHYNWQAHYSWCRIVPRASHRNETRARRQGLNRCRGAIGGGLIRRTFVRPRTGGLRLDWCKYWSVQCGRPAANTFCRTRGYRYATSWRKAVDVGRFGIRTRVIGSGQICNGNFCDSFRWIRCSR